eukprot:SAG31_NODE_2682_length_5257_cov_9.066693_5_plen_87_part_00
MIIMPVPLVTASYWRSYSVKSYCPRVCCSHIPQPHQARMYLTPHFANSATHGDTFSISALHIAIKFPYFSNSGHKNEKVTSYLDSA